MAWWQFVEATGYHPLSDSQIAAIPLTGGQRTKAIRQMERARAALMPED